jgi:hypothetical protein
LIDQSTLSAFIPNSIKSLNSVRIKGVIPPINTQYGRQGGIYITIFKKTGVASHTIEWSYTKTDVGTVNLSVPINLSLDENSTYTVFIKGGTESTTFSDILFSVTE